MNYEKISGFFKSSNGVNNTAYYIYVPTAAKIKGVVQIVHGMCEYIERYEDFADFLCKDGYIVCGNDNLGHGASVSSEEDYGFFAEKDGWDALIEDTNALRREVQAQYPELPYFLLGHSMGSFVARTYCLKYEEGLAGAIFSGTGHFGKGIVMAGTAIAAVQCFFGGAQKPCMLLHHMNFSANNKKVENPQTDSDWLTRDGEQVAKYKADPLCGFPFTARAYADMFDGLRRLYPEHLSAMKKDVPVLLIAGDHDPVGSNGQGVRQVYEEIRAAGVRDVTLKLYEGGRHEMFNEINREEVYADLIGWLNSKLA